MGAGEAEGGEDIVKEAPVRRGWSPQHIIASSWTNSHSSLHPIPAAPWITGARNNVPSWEV